MLIQLFFVTGLSDISLVYNAKIHVYNAIDLRYMLFV